MPGAPSFPVDLLGEYSPTGGSEFILCADLAEDPTQVSVVGDWVPGEYLTLVSDSENPENTIATSAQVVVDTPRVLLPADSDLGRIASRVAEDPDMTHQVGAWLSERVLDCPGLTADGECGALNRAGLEQVLLRAGSEYDLMENQ